MQWLWKFLFSGMCSAGAPTAGYEPPAAAAGDGTGRPAGEEGCWDPGLQREWSLSQQRCTHMHMVMCQFSSRVFNECVYLQQSGCRQVCLRNRPSGMTLWQRWGIITHTHTHTLQMIYRKALPGDDGWNFSVCGRVFTAFMCGISHLWLLRPPSPLNSLCECESLIDWLSISDQPVEFSGGVCGLLPRLFSPPAHFTCLTCWIKVSF